MKHLKSGDVRIARAMVGSSIWQLKGRTPQVAIGMIFMAVFKEIDTVVSGVKVKLKTGQFASSLREIAEYLNMNFRVVSYAVHELIRVGFCTAESVRGYTVFTLPNYVRYQGVGRYARCSGLPTLDAAGAAVADAAGASA